MKGFGIFSMILAFLVFILFSAVTVNSVEDKDKGAFRTGILVTIFMFIWALTGAFLVIVCSRYGI